MLIGLTAERATVNHCQINQSANVYWCLNCLLMFQ